VNSFIGSIDGTLNRTVDEDDYKILIDNWKDYFTSLGIYSFEDLQEFVRGNEASFSKRVDVIKVDGQAYKIKKITGMVSAMPLSIALSVQRPTSKEKVFRIAKEYTPDKENALGITIVGDSVTVDDGWHTTNGKMLGQLTYMIHEGWIDRENVEDGLPYILFSVEGIELDTDMPERVIKTVRSAKFISRNNDTTLATTLEQMFAALMDRNEKQREAAETFFDSHRILGVRPIDDEFNESDRAPVFSDDAYDSDVGTPTKEEFYWEKAQMSMFDNRKNVNGHTRYNEFAEYNSGWHAMQIIKDVVPIGSRHRLNAHILIAMASFIRHVANRNDSYIARNFGKVNRINPDKGQYLNVFDPSRKLFGGVTGEFNVKLAKVIETLFGMDMAQDKFVQIWKGAISEYLPYKLKTGEEAQNPLYSLAKDKSAMWQGMLELIKWQFEKMYPDYVIEWNIPRTTKDFSDQFNANEESFTVGSSYDDFSFESEDDEFEDVDE